MLEYSLEAQDGVSKELRQWMRRLPKLSRLILDRFGHSVAGEIAAQRLTGQVLNVRSGDLKGSINYRMNSDEEVEIGSNMKYAPVHEFGATIKPKAGKYLRFQIPGVGWRMAQSVTIPARPFMRPGIEELFSSGRADRISSGAFREHKRREGWE